MGIDAIERVHPVLQTLTVLRQLQELRQDGDPRNLQHRHAQTCSDV